MNDSTFEVSATAIIRRRRDGKPHGEWEYLVTKRADTKKRFPGLWTVPGGHVEPTDYIIPENKDGVSYGAVEAAVRREVYEETHIQIQPPLKYIASMLLDHGKVFVLSMLVTVESHQTDNIRLDPTEATEYRWVTRHEARLLPMIDGILDELYLAETVL